MRSIFLIILFAAAVTACAPKQEAATEAQAPNTLTEAQKAEGWELLFDGQSLTGWRSYQNREQNCWEVADGALHCKSKQDSTADKRSDLLTEGQYGNYELSFEWKISEGGNSGVIYRATEEFDAPYYSGPEYQVIDDIGYKGDLTELQKAGADYDMYPADGKTINGPGEWNQGKIIVNGNHCEHWVNGKKVVEYEFGSEDWLKRKEASKWKDAAGYGASASGHIDFQDHDHEVWYRSIMIKKL